MSTDKNWVVVADVDELSSGRSKAVAANGRNIALFRCDETYFAVENECPHHGAPLCDGFVRGGSIVCAWHGWQFDLASGECLNAPGCDVEAYEVKIEDGRVKVAVG